MRTSGVLLPIFSLPGKYGIGCFSREAYRFVDFLKESHQSYWQILPLGPTSFGDSPYQSFSTFAGNPYFIDLETLMKQGLLTKEECDGVDFGSEDTDIAYDKLYQGRWGLLRKAYQRSNIAKSAGFRTFCEENSYWLSDYAMFMALKDQFGGVSYLEWPEDIRNRDASVLLACEQELQDDLMFYQYLQYEFDCQWNKLKFYANEQGIRIIGDIPIYVSADSADVWAHPDLFQLKEDRTPAAVAGCPPDGFSATGQLWGNPLYDWSRNHDTGYQWWIRRIAKSVAMYDVVRIDHFRGFDAYYSIPAGDETAEYGHWEKGPGMDLFDAIRIQLGDLPIIAEDLGYMTDSVRALVRDSGFPNMKVLEFAFDSRDSSGPSEYLPHNYDKNCVVYTGTHDNETLVEWLSHILPEETVMIQDYIGRNLTSAEALADELVRLAQSSVADTCIIPIQDYLLLGKEARINQPSVVGTNWKWRLRSEQIGENLADKISKLTITYGRG